MNTSIQLQRELRAKKLHSVIFLFIKGFIENTVIEFSHSNGSTYVKTLRIINHTRTVFAENRLILDSFTNEWVYYVMM